ncbi:MAG: trypsin-like peptidase domain-containing protein [Chloroflexota bacterium]
MQDPKYRLETYAPQQEKTSNHSSKQVGNQFQQRLLLALLLTLSLGVGALFSPIIWENIPASADSLASQTAAPLPQIDLSTSLFDDQEELANLYDALAPSVVAISVRTNVQSQFGSPFRQDGEDVPQLGGEGSGWIFDNEGHIVTNNHVVEDASSVTVLFYNGMWADAEVIATDPQADLAVIKVTPPDDIVWQPLPLAKSGDIRVGHMVIAMGNPFGLENTMTTGIVSAMGRSQRIGGDTRYQLPDIIQTDAAINPGNSGGPLLNLRGEVVGVNFAIQSEVRSNSGVGFAIPVAIVERIVPALISDGVYDYPFLGISGNSLNPFTSELYNAPENLLGVYVASVVDDGPSADAGIYGDDEGGGDIIVAIDGEAVGSFEDLIGYLYTEKMPGEVVTLTVMRDGNEVNLPVELTNRPDARIFTRANNPFPSGQVNARDAIALAVEAVEEEDLLDGEIIQRIASQEELDGEEVWVVELSTEDQVAQVVIKKEGGELVEIVVE